MPPKTSYQQKNKTRSPFDTQRNLEYDDSVKWIEIEKNKVQKYRNGNKVYGFSILCNDVYSIFCFTINIHTIV